MLSTEFGEASFNKWNNSKTKITIVIDKETQPIDKMADTDPEMGGNGMPILNEDDQYKSAKVTFYKKTIDSDRQEGSGKRMEGASFEEALGAAATHEVYHNDPDQIFLDQQSSDNEENELQQKPNKNLPINAEVNFRKEYQEKNPTDKKACEKGMKIYEDRGYKGLNEKGKPIK